jgi:hypothetical protein
VKCASHTSSQESNSTQLQLDSRQSYSLPGVPLQERSAAHLDAACYTHAQYAACTQQNNGSHNISLLATQQIRCDACRSTYPCWSCPASSCTNHNGVRNCAMYMRLIPIINTNNTSSTLLTASSRDSREDVACLPSCAPATLLQVLHAACSTPLCLCGRHDRPSVR